MEFIIFNLNLLSLLFPLAYLTILLGSLYTFSTLYRRRKAVAAQSLAPYFAPHVQRNMYYSLTNLAEHDASAKVPDSILRAALLNRAVEDIARIVEIRNRKQALAQLLQKGVVGEEIWQRLLRAEAEMEGEVKDVVAEANALSGGSWGQVIFQSANEMANNAIVRRRLDAIKATVQPEKAWWEGVREAARRELEGDTDGGKKKKEEARKEEATVVPPPPPGESKEKMVVKVGSGDEDTVLVEPPTVEGDQGGPGGGKNKKKKGKK